MASPTKTAPSAVEILRLFAKDRGRSVEFGDALAQRAVAQLPTSVDGLRVLDLGCGPGAYSAELERAGAKVVSVEIDLDELLRSKSQLLRPLVSDGTSLAFSDCSFDAVVCSNVLEHTPDPEGVLAEIQRVLVPGGWSYVSWTNWYSPWGGHAVAPLHYLGPERSIRVWRRLFGEPKGRNLPLVTVFPTSIGATLRWVRERSGIQLVKAYPRYWPWARVIMKVPGLREVASWNCVLELRKN
jgi:SAM-dependent methyltransferase